MITIPLDISMYDALSDSMVYREVFDYLEKNVAPEFKGKRQYAWLHYSKTVDDPKRYWQATTALHDQLTIEVFPSEHETILALKYGLVTRGGRL